MEEKDKNTEAESSDKSVKSYGLATKFIIGLCISAAVSFVPFTGYAYLNSYLMGAGFSAPVISPSVYELVFYFLIGLGTNFKDFIPFMSDQFPWYFVIEVYLICTLFYCARVLIAKYAITSKESVKEFDPDDWMRRRILESADSWFKFFKNGLILLLFPTAGMILIWLLVFTLIFAPWLIGSAGIRAGYQDGADMYEGGVCSDVDWSEKAEGITKVRGCVEITLEDGQVKTGHKIYESKDRIYFITNTEALELRKDMSVISRRPFVERVDSHIGNDDEEG